MLTAAMLLGVVVLISAAFVTRFIDRQDAARNRAAWSDTER